MSAHPSEHRGRRGRRLRLFRKRFLGYDPKSVHEALEARDTAVREAQERAGAAEGRAGAHRAEAEAAERRLAELDQVAARLASMVVDRDQELRRLRADLQTALQRDDGGLRALAAMAGDLEMVRRQAGRQATRIRLRALRQAAEATERMEDVEAAEGRVSERLLARVEEAIERVGSEDDWAEDDLAERAAANGHAEREAGELFDGLVEVEVGPLSDFSQLVGFEDAAGEIGATSEISVKRFTEGRATLAMRFKHPVELLSELEERAPFGFSVRDRRPHRIVLDLDG